MLAHEIGANKDLKEAHMWVNIGTAMICKKNRLSCKWNQEMFKGPTSPIINHLWDLRIEIERQLKPAQITSATNLAKDMISKNEYIRQQLK